ncbi:MAG: hypothetical protein K0Q66_289 [Chitinophagaceae bacterium]|nr:hypothetical protein [Chitinophagaceae bacterium]
MILALLFILIFRLLLQKLYPDINSLLQKPALVINLCWNSPPANPMDDVIFYFYHNGIFLLLTLATVKIIIILLYKGLDFWYVVDNFFTVYAELGVAAFPRRRLFRMVHNILTISFFAVLVFWVAIVGVVRLSK